MEETGLRFGKIAPRIEAGVTVLCFESGETETVSAQELGRAAELYGGMYVRRVAPFMGGATGCLEIQLSNTPEAGRT